MCLQIVHRRVDSLNTKEYVKHHTFKHEQVRWCTGNCHQNCPLFQPLAVHLLIWHLQVILRTYHVNIDKNKLYEVLTLNYIIARIWRSYNCAMSIYISGGLEKSKSESGGFETSRDFAARRPFALWIEGQVYSELRHGEKEPITSFQHACITYFTMHSKPSIILSSLVNQRSAPGITKLHIWGD